MQSSLIAVVLCILAQASFVCAAQADGRQLAMSIKADQPPVATRSKTRVGHVQSTVKTAGTPTPAAGLITAATAGTRDAPAATRATPLANATPDEGHPRRAGPAMLLAALALMTAIALRRHGAGMR